MVPVWMNFSDLFKVTIIQRQITWKWYNIQLYLQWLTYRESYNDPSNGAILNDLERPLPSVSRPMFVEPFMRYSASKNGATLKLKVGVVQWNTNRDLHTPYSTVSFRMTLSDLEWLSEIVNDTKRRALSATAELLVFCNFCNGNVTTATFLTLSLRCYWQRLFNRVHILKVSQHFLSFSSEIFFQLAQFLPRNAMQARP